MLADSIIKILNAIKHVTLDVMPGGIDVPFDLPLLQYAEERSGNSIVPTVLLTTHAECKLVIHSPTVEIITAKLAALVDR